MQTILNRQFKQHFAVPYGCYKLITSRRSILRQSGWFESIRASKPQDETGGAVPWMNYSVVELLSERLSDSFDVFEYGSGFSTCFFAEHARSVVSVEYNGDWLERVMEMIPENADVVYQPLDDSGSYSRSIAKFGKKFDVIVVDGQERVACLEAALEFVTDVGVILLDDSDREGYRAGFEAMSEARYRHLTIGGIKPGSASRHQTTIFYRDRNCFGL